MERGFSLNIVSTVISQSTPTCVSKELAERCSGFVTTIVMQVSLIHLLLFWFLKPGSIHAPKFSIIRDLIAFLSLNSSSIVEKAD
ncbi:hypothetical protein Gogos_014744 [Gossypium gossypioides]|uniref:Uncharacterized protein n=1 Tax=Gossypium gossypioides TaxID=34282 RepID=A0A7J9BZQ3_GOSGO|nr:hypothetical protein [Gossypium gossypioides]